jgi:hypothetical protein
MRHTILGAGLFVVACGAGLGQGDSGGVARQPSGWSAWKSLLAEKYDAQFDARSFVGDPRFEYRWKQEWTESGYACTVEVRPADDADRSDKVPEVDVMYQSPEYTYAAPDVPIVRKPSQVHFFATLDVRIGNKLRHANFNLTDSSRVGAVAAGHFSPGVGIPAF